MECTTRQSNSLFGAQTAKLMEFVVLTINSLRISLWLYKNIGFGRYDDERKGHITHQQFLQKIGVNFAPGDDSGTSKQIVDSSIKTLDEHHTSMMLKHEMQTYHQANAAWNMPVETVFVQLR